MTVSERRSTQRMPVDCKVSFFHLPPSSNSPTFRALNLSLTGACIEAPTPFAPGAVLAFHLITPEHQVADVRARVVHTILCAPTLYHVGVRFTHLSADDHDLLARQLDRVGLNFQ